MFAFISINFKDILKIGLTTAKIGFIIVSKITNDSFNTNYTERVLNMCKVYGYARISTQTQNIERQIRNIRKYNDSAVIYQEAYTGTKTDRPEWIKLLKQIEKQISKGEKDITIIFDSVSRMSRNAEEGVKQYFELYKTTPDSALKRDLMGTITSAENRDAVLGLFVHLKDGTIRAQDRLSFFLQLLRNHRVRNEAFDWLYQNWDWVYEDEGDKTIPEYPRYSAHYVRRLEEAEKFKQFFDRYKKEAILTRDVSIAYAEIDARIALIISDQSAVFDYLKNEH